MTDGYCSHYSSVAVAVNMLGDLYGQGHRLVPLVLLNNHLVSHHSNGNPRSL